MQAAGKQSHQPPVKSGEAIGVDWRSVWSVAARIHIGLTLRRRTGRFIRHEIAHLR
jgi:hypothetical protein